MIIDKPYSQILLNEAAYAIIHEHKPEELLLYQSIRDKYLAEPETFIEQATDDEPLAFGSGVPLSTFTQLVFPTLGPMLDLLVDEAMKAMGKDAGTQAIAWVRSLFNDQKSDLEPAFTPAELVRIKQALTVIAEKEARRLNVKKSEILCISDALISRLVTENEKLL